MVGCMPRRGERRLIMAFMAVAQEHQP